MKKIPFMRAKPSKCCIRKVRVEIGHGVPLPLARCISRREAAIFAAKLIKAAK